MTEKNPVVCIDTASKTVWPTSLKFDASVLLILKVYRWSSQRD